MDKKKLISEELKRHMELLEYTFYMEDKPAEDDIDNLLLGAEKLYEQDPVPAEDTVEVDAEEETTESPLVFKYLKSKSLVSCEEPLTTFSVFNFVFTLVSV